jgi:hypothetical protein
VNFYATDPVIVRQDGWLDYWFICDDNNCFMFFSDDHGRWYRAQTTVAVLSPALSHLNGRDGLHALHIEHPPVSGPLRRVISR